MLKVPKRRVADRFLHAVMEEEVLLCLCALQEK
jgi:hypothetical protein